jgi:2-phosphosulfolactate phosphatase
VEPSVQKLNFWMPIFKTMKFHYTTLSTCHTATGLVVVIDVIRAFTNAAFVFSRGAERIYPVSGVEEALTLKRQIPNALACGEVGGIPPEGFDFGNSPTQTETLDLAGRAIVQRTSAGTQGIVRSMNASTLFAASLVVAGATARQVLRHQPVAVTFVITGLVNGKSGEEDQACAEYLEQLMQGRSPDPQPYMEAVYQSREAAFHSDPDFPAFPKSDLDHCIAEDKFNFALPVVRENGRFVMRARKEEDVI